MARRRGHIFGTCYLIHFSRPFKSARHYLGFTNQLQDRLAEHRAGKGSPLMRAVTAAKIPWRVVRKWNGVDGFFESMLKGGHDNGRLCPVCNPKFRKVQRAGAASRSRKVKRHS
jgi:hypothetical protein